MPDETPEIRVAGEVPAAPLVLADRAFVAQIGRAGHQVQALQVNSLEDANNASSLLAELTGYGKKIETTRKALKQPYLDIGRRIDDVAQKALDRIGVFKRAVQAKLTDWNDREAARRAEEERKRQEEIRALEEKRKQEEEAAAALVAAAPEEALDLAFDEPPPIPKTATDQRIEALRYAPAAPVEKPAGVRMLVSLRFRVTSVAQLPEAFVVRSANERLIRETYCIGFKDGAPLPELPGLKFHVERTPISTGSTGF